MDSKDLTGNILISYYSLKKISIYGPIRTTAANLIQLTFIERTLSISRIRVESVRLSLRTVNTYACIYTFSSITQAVLLKNQLSTLQPIHTHTYTQRFYDFLSPANDCNFLFNMKCAFVSFVKNFFSSYCSHNFCHVLFEFNFHSFVYIQF